LHWLTVPQIAQSPYHGIISGETVARTTADDFYPITPLRQQG
jgi:hypothetical protein